MRIAEINIDGFGVWNGLKLEDLSDKLTVVYGPNEAGKTTLMQFVRAVLFGFNVERRERYLPPVHGGLWGGTLTLAEKNTQYQVSRFLTEKSSGKFFEEFTIHDESGRDQKHQTLDRLLSGVDERTLNNIFAVGLREIQELATLNDTEAAEHLYAITSGLDRVALVEARKELSHSRKRLLVAGNRDSEIHQLLKRRRRITNRIDELSEMSRRWGRQSPSDDVISTRLEDAKKELVQLKRESQVTEVAMNLSDPWQRRAAIDQRLSYLATLSPVSSTTLDELSEMKVRRENYKRRERSLKKRWKTKHRELGRHSDDLRMLEQRSRVQSILEQESWLYRTQPQVVRLEKDIEELDLKLRAKQAALGPLGSELDLFSDFHSFSLVLASLAEPAREFREAKRRLASAKRRANESSKVQQVALDVVEQALAARSETDLATAVEKAAHKVELLRRRVEVDERLQQTERHRGELDEESHAWLGRQVMSNQQIWAVGALFVVGTVMVLCALFGWLTVLGLSYQVRWLLAVLGLSCGVASAVAKASLEHTAEERFDDCRKQVSLLEKQHRQTCEERAQLDEVLPGGQGPYALQLSSAETDLDALQQLVPLDTKRRAGLGPDGDGKRRVLSAIDRHKRARHHWCDALVAASLPDDVEPDHLSRMVQDAQVADELRRQWQVKKRELEIASTEIDVLRDRIDRILVDFDIQVEEDDTLALLDQVRRALDQQEQHAKQRKSLRREIKQLRSNQKRCAQGVVRLYRRRRTLLAEAGVADEEQLRLLVEEAGQAQQLRQERNEVNGQIAKTLGTDVDEEQVNELLRSHSESDIERILEEIWDRQQDCENRLNRLFKQSEQWHSEMEQAHDDRRLATAQLELGCVEQQLQNAVRRWQKISISSHVLDDVCKAYEAERQPETLCDASRLFEKMTAGRYRRVWTPLEEDVLRVEDSRGQRLDVSSLSTGTREQLFLSLRLAVAQMFGRGGRRLPLLLDDVLVNFDIDRTKITGRVLRDFCKSGHQLFLFTCHKHVVKTLRSLGAAVIDLPGFEPPEDVELEHDEIEKKPPRRKRRLKKKTAAGTVAESRDESVIESASQDLETTDERISEKAAVTSGQKTDEPRPWDLAIGVKDAMGAVDSGTSLQAVVEMNTGIGVSEEEHLVADSITEAEVSAIWPHGTNWDIEPSEVMGLDVAWDPARNVAFSGSDNSSQQTGYPLAQAYSGNLLVVHQAQSLPTWHMTEIRTKTDADPLKPERRRQGSA